MDVPVNAELGKHLIEYLTEADFDISHSRYLKDEYGGAIGPAGYVWWKRETKPRPHGIGHGYSFVVKRIMDNKPIPIVPVLQNTCYPPNQPTPKRCYAFGKAIKAAVEAWDSNARVAIMASGGLSHFVLDEDIDQQLIRGMREKNGEILSSLPQRAAAVRLLRNPELDHHLRGLRTSGLRDGGLRTGRPDAGRYRRWLGLCPLDLAPIRNDNSKGLCRWHSPFCRLKDRSIDIPLALRVG